MSLPPSDASGVRSSRQVAALYAIFFVSGFCGLIYESIWSHYLKLLLGHAAYAQAVVLVVFVGGLAVGAWLTGRWSERIRHPLALYALVEAIVGVIAFAFQRVFEAASAWATTSFLPAVCGEPGSCMASWLLAAALILPSSILLGTTFPLMSAGVMRLGVRPGRGLSLLYFLNSAGAALGVLGAGFLLIPSFGLPGTMLLVGAMNLAVALAALGAWHTSEDVAAPAAPAAEQRDAAATRQLRLLLAVAALTGLTSFIYEVVWIRMLTLVFGAATHSFELMLAPFILGLALGAWWIRDRIDSTAQPVRLLGLIQIAMGVLAVATLPLYVSLYDAMAFVLRTLTRTEDGYAVFNLLTGLMAAAVMLPATVCAGMTLPLITAILLRQGHGERQVGQVYGINTFGAIAGVLLTVHLLLPLLGLKGALVLGGALDVAIGFWLWRQVQASAATPREGVSAVQWGVAAVVALSALVVVPIGAQMGTDRLASGVFRSGQARLDASRGEVVFHRDGKTATVTLLRSPDGVLSLLTNGKSDGATHPEKKVETEDDHTMVLLGAMGPAHHPGARRVAVIGLGTGTSSSVLLESPAVEVLDTIEIEPMMVEAARQFRPRVDKVYADPRSRIIIDDARAHFSKTRERYDLIVSEPSNPWVSGVAGLFTTEFYRHISAHLAADGHFVQWLHVYESSPEVTGSILRAFASVFPEYTAYAANQYDIVLVARNDRRPPRIDAEALARMPGLGARLQEIGITSPAMLAAHAAGPGRAIQVLAQSFGTPPNSDFFPYVDNHAAAARFRRETATQLFALPLAPVPLLEFWTGAPAHAGQVTQANAHMPKHVAMHATAWSGLRYLQGQALAPAEAQRLGPATVDFALVRSWAAACSFPADTGAAWAAVVRVASSLNPGLSPAQAGGYWKGLATRCARNLQPAQAAWIELLAAVAERDREAVHQKGLQVLALDQAATPDSQAYVTLATVSAALAAGRKLEAGQLMTQQRAKLTEEQMEQPWFRFLVLALAAANRPAPPARP